MSYIAGTFADTSPLYNSTPMVYDIAAIQFLYGTKATMGSVTHNLDPNVSEVKTLWDSNGGDSIKVTGATSSDDAHIDLREGAGYYNQIGDNVLFIAYGSNINKATGGPGDDNITGNDNDNTIWGGSGDDWITTGEADDYDVVVFDFDPEDHDTITDFTIGEDKIDLTSFGMFRADVEAAAVYSGGNTTLHLNGHEIVVQGVSKTDLFNPSNNAFIGLIEGTAGALVNGTSSGETINATDGCTIYNDTIEGHGGNDLLYGLAGDAIHARLLQAANDNTLTPCLRRNCI